MSTKFMSGQGSEVYYSFSFFTSLLPPRWAHKATSLLLAPRPPPASEPLRLPPLRQQNIYTCISIMKQQMKLFLILKHMQFFFLFAKFRGDFEQFEHLFLQSKKAKKKNWRSLEPLAPPPKKKISLRGHGGGVIVPHFFFFGIILN